MSSKPPSKKAHKKSISQLFLEITKSHPIEALSSEKIKEIFSKKHGINLNDELFSLGTLLRSGKVIPNATTAGKLKRKASKEAQGAVSKKVAKTALKRDIKTTVKTTLKKVPETALKKPTKASIKKVPETVLKKTARASVKKVPETALRKTTKANIKKVPETASKKTTKASIKKVPETALKIHSKKAVKTTPKKAVKTTPKKAAKTALKKVGKTAEIPMETVSQQAALLDKDFDSEFEKVSSAREEVNVAEEKLFSREEHEANRPEM